MTVDSTGNETRWDIGPGPLCLTVEATVPEQESTEAISYILLSETQNRHQHIGNAGVNDWYSLNGGLVTMVIQV